jgi:hypothetical protein
MLFALIVIAVGFGRGWFQIASSEDNRRDEVRVNLTVDRGKIRSDTHKAADTTEAEASRLAKDVKQGASDLKERIRDKTAKR